MHRFFRLGVNLECFLEWGTINCSIVSNADVLIIDECNMLSARQSIIFAALQQRIQGKISCCLLENLFGDLFQLPAVDNPHLFQSIF